MPHPYDRIPLLLHTVCMSSILCSSQRRILLFFLWLYWKLWINTKYSYVKDFWYRLVSTISIVRGSTHIFSLLQSHQRWNSHVICHICLADHTSDPNPQNKHQGHCLTCITQPSGIYCTHRWGFCKCKLSLSVSMGPWCNRRPLFKGQKCRRVFR